LPGGPYKFKEISRISGSCRHPAIGKSLSVTSPNNIKMASYDTMKARDNGHAMPQEGKLGALHFFMCNVSARFINSSNVSTVKFQINFN